MSNIEQEIEQIAESLEKSNQTPKDKLFETIRQMGPAQIKARLATLEKSEKELLLSALQEMKKAVEMDKNYQAKFVQGKLTDTIIQEDKADDDQDEKLVMESAATVNHQGTPTPGWEGQVIKGKEPMKKEEDKKIADKEADKEVGEHEDKMHGKKCKKGDMPFGDLKDDKKSKDEKKEALKKIKKSVEDQLKEFGVEATSELVKSEMKRLMSEEDSAPAVEAPVAQAPVVEAAPAPLKKSVAWNDENALLKANTNGRNHHFSMDEYIDQVLAESAKPAEEVKKSEGEAKEDLNDIIAKGGDANWDMVNTDRLLKANGEKIKGKFVKSFEEDEIAAALGLTPEEAKKILG